MRPASAIGNGTSTGRRVGLSRAVSGIGPFLALAPVHAERPLLRQLGDRRRLRVHALAPVRLVPCVLVVAVALGALAHGVLVPAAVTIVLARALIGTTGPVLAARERAGSTVERLAAFATWVDSGLAVGPLVSGFVVARYGLPALYQTLAGAILVALVTHLAARRRA